MDQIEILMHASLPPSPTSSPTHHLRLGGNNVSNLRIHRGGPTASTVQHSEHFSSQTMETSQRGEKQQQCIPSLDDAITSSSSSIQHMKDEMPSTPERNSQSMTFSSPFSDESTPTKVLDVARKNC